MISALLFGAGGIAVGWIAHTAYVGWLWKTSAAMRRRARGGYRKRR